MPDEDDIHGFLPPKPPHGGTPAPVPPPEKPRETFDPLDLHRAPQATAHRNPLGFAAVVLGSLSLVLLFLSLGVAFPFASVLSLVALLTGRRAGHRIATILGWVGIVCALVAALAWAGLDSAGFSPDELPAWLDERREQLRGDAR